MNNDIIEAVNTQVAEAVAEYRMGEDVHYGVSLTVVPTEQGATPALLIVVSVPGALLGSRLTATHLDPNIQVQATTPGIIRQMIEQLLQARSAQTSEALAGPSPQQNGQGQHHPGLIDPRQGM